jgi:sarcosine oxidase subunit alpha
VVATGCIERPLLFENNERPGVMQIECALRLARTWGILPGSEAVSASGMIGAWRPPSNYATSVSRSLGWPTPAKTARIRLLDALAQRRITVLKGWVARKVHGCRQVAQVTLSSINGHFNRKLSCDLLVASVGLTP